MYYSYGWIRAGHELVPSRPVAGGAEPKSRGVSRLSLICGLLNGTQRRINKQTRIYSSLEADRPTASNVFAKSDMSVAISRRFAEQLFCLFAGTICLQARPTGCNLVEYENWGNPYKTRDGPPPPTTTTAACWKPRGSPNLGLWREGKKERSEVGSFFALTPQCTYKSPHRQRRRGSGGGA